MNSALLREVLPADIGDICEIYNHYEAGRWVDLSYWQLVV